MICMRLVRPALVRRLFIALGAALPVAVLVTGAPASTSRQLAAVTFELRSAPTCDKRTEGTRLGRSCVNTPKRANWTIADGSAQWNLPGNFQTSYSWTIPKTIPSAGAPVKLNVTAQELSKNPNARVCPVIGVGGGFRVKGGATQILKCAESGQSASGSLSLNVFPPAAGTVVSLTVGIQDGPVYTYKYRAGGAEAPRCKRPKRSSSGAAQRDGRPAGASAKCEVTVSFALVHGGWPKRKPKAFIDVTTNAIGTVSFDFDSDKLAKGPPFKTPLLEPNDITLRVVRTIHVIEDVPTPTPKKARLVFRARPRGLIHYYEHFDDRTLIVPLDLVSSNDPDCPAGEQALLQLIDDRLIDDGSDDEFNLQIPCPVHRGSFVNQGNGRKPLVRVVIIRK